MAVILSQEVSCQGLVRGGRRAATPVDAAAESTIAVAAVALLRLQLPSGRSSNRQIISHLQQSSGAGVAVEQGVVREC